MSGTAVNGVAKSSKRRRSTHATVLYQGRTAALPLRFVVVGGGIAGLACAFALTNAGHTVTVLEAADSLQRDGGAVQLPPNLMRLLYLWGLGPKIEALTLVLESMHFVDYDTGEKIGVMRWADEVLDVLDADYPVINHDDLYRILYEAAVRAGAQVRFGAGVSAVDSSVPSVTLASEEVVTADLIIGADGHRSLVRKVISSEELPPSEEPSTFGVSIYSGNIPISLIREDPELNVFLEHKRSMIWMGSNRSAVGFHGAGGNEYALHIMNKDDSHPECLWRKCDSPAEEHDLQRNVDGCEKQLRELIDLLPSVVYTKHIPREHGQDWVDRGGKVILLGEAAHPTIPCVAEGTAMAVEDAVVLGNLLSRLNARAQLPIFLNAYQDLRQERCQVANLNDQTSVATLWIPDGPERDARNERMANATTDGHVRFDEGLTRDQWESSKEMFAYDADEAAEAWYVEWGILGERTEEAREAQSPNNVLGVAVRVQVTGD